MVLPSNSSMKFYPDNTLTSFKTRLQSTISLTGDWEVGLAEIQFPRNWQTINRKNRGFTIHSSQGNAYLVLETGYYNTVQEVVNEMNLCVENHIYACKDGDSACWPTFKYDTVSKRVTALVPKQSAIVFNQRLMAILGFGPEQTQLHNTGATTVHHVGSQISDINEGLYGLYIYCDLLEHVIVGDVEAPLLRVVDASGASGEIINRIYEKPRYVRFRRNRSTPSSCI